MATEPHLRLSPLRPLFFLVVKILVFVLLGMHVRRRQWLPQKGPAIIAANHNSHLDTMVLMSLFRIWDLRRIRPVAAADYFLRGGLMSWFALRIIGIIPIERAGSGTARANVLEPCHTALARGDILILFPEGTRGEAEQLAQFKKGIAHLAQQHPSTPVIPVFMHGLGKALPKGDWVLVPFFCDVFVGEPFHFTDSIASFMETTSSRFQQLAQEGHFAAWE